MSEFSSGLMDSSTSDATLKRKSSYTHDDEPVPKMIPKYLTTKRGLFKDILPIYEELNRKDYPVLLFQENKEKIDLFKVNKILKDLVPPNTYVKPIGNYYMKIFFATKKEANSFILNKTIHSKYNWSVKIPFDQIESQGVIKVPTEIDDTELLSSLKSPECEVLGIKRFKKKLPDGSITSLPTVLVTFLNTNRPNHVTYEHLWFEVREYFKPLVQCFKCYKFNHTSGSCKNAQVCSICAGNHYYKDCLQKDKIKCNNCQGPHVAVAYECPLKASKVAEIKNRILGGTTYASATKGTKSALLISNDKVSKDILQNSISKTTSPQKRFIISDILNCDSTLNGIIKTIVDLISRKDGAPITSKIIKELLIHNLSSIK
ncbi:hypothetical protein PYW07_007791 [Mythimna separata]|uniref:Uncharacterized protein n=1 Tax=Mythimna separata TaxID=271217 RepID=A0AAD8DU36_MYTSE|nr:hypothetical protein PYW07_007791 [Mythimna separata]